jgi:quercetin dioxygenase-like cupin family protein
MAHKPDCFYEARPHNPKVMANQKAATPVLRAPGEGRSLKAFGEEVILHLTGEETGGEFTLWTEITPPGGGPPPHYHLNEDECFVVQEGRFAFFVHGQWQEYGPGSVVFMPRPVVHTFKNVGDKPGRLLISTRPSGFENFFGRCAEEFKQPGGPNMERIIAISAEHGIHFVQP